MGARLVRAAAVALLLPLVLVLSGCLRLGMALTINPDDTVDLGVEVVDRTGTMTREDLRCEDVGSQLGAAGLPEDLDYTAAELDEGGDLGCAFTVAGTAMQDLTAQGLSITRDGDLYTFTLEGDASDPEQLRSTPELEVVLAVTFPGEVVDAGGGQVSGTTVSWTDPGVLATGATATGRAAPATGDTSGASEPAPTTGPLDAIAAARDAAGSSALPWLLVALGGLLLVAVLVVVVSRRRARRTRQGTGHDIGSDPGIW